MEGPEITVAEAVIDNGTFGTRTVRFETGRLAKQAGLQPIDRRHTGLPFDALKLSTERGPGRLAALADRALVRLWPTMFAYQFVYELDVIPALDEPLDVATDQPG